MLRILAYADFNLQAGICFCYVLTLTLLKTRGYTRLADMLPSKYEDNALQIKEKSTERTAPFFVLEVTARSAADILGIHPNSAALFYRKIRTVINYHLALAADEVFEGPVELDESYFGGRRKGRRGRGR